MRAALENGRSSYDHADFFVLSFYYGLKCVGGQLNQLFNRHENAYIKMNVDRGNYRSIEARARAN